LDFLWDSINAYFKQFWKYFDHVSVFFFLSHSVLEEIKCFLLGIELIHGSTFWSEHVDHVAWSTFFLEKWSLHSFLTIAPQQADISLLPNMNGKLSKKIGTIYGGMIGTF
jgi:hypothetical protein